MLAYLNLYVDNNSVLAQGQTPKKVVMEQEHCACISKAVYSRSAGQSKSKADIITTPFFKNLICIVYYKFSIYSIFSYVAYKNFIIQIFQNSVFAQESRKFKFVLVFSEVKYLLNYVF